MIFAVDIFEPYGYQFFQNGLVVATIAGALCGLLGVFVILRGMSYIGHGLSHAVFGGAAASAVLRVNYFLGAGFWGLISGLLIARVARRRVIGADAAIGVVTTASFALGLALMNRYGQASKSIEAVLFGSVLG
ncbi:MAG: metal ABC transporter permease, partial [Actinobacteria bacterium]|nr:metal ABC transporter permease [Actinomycetota bacterium]